MKQKVANTSLNRRRSTRSVLLRMAADAERADRIRKLKDERPDLTWGRIAEACGVTERSVHDWRKDGSLTYDHAKALARVFDVDLDWLWRGEHQTPDLMGSLSVADRLGRLEAKVDELLALAVERELEAADRQDDPRDAEAGSGAS